MPSHTSDGWHAQCCIRKHAVPKHRMLVCRHAHDAQPPPKVASAESLSDAVLPAPGQAAKPTQSELMKLTARTLKGAKASPKHKEAAPAAESGAAGSAERSPPDRSSAAAPRVAEGAGHDRQGGHKDAEERGRGRDAPTAPAAQAPQADGAADGDGAGGGVGKVRPVSAVKHQRSSSRPPTVSSLKTIVEAGSDEVEDMGC